VLQAPQYLTDALRAMDPELSLRFEPRISLFFIARQPAGTRMTQVIKWICAPCVRAPCRGFLWPDWFNTVEWIREADWGAADNRLSLAAKLSALDQHSETAEKKHDEAASDRIHGELKPMTAYALRKGILERRIGRG